jgi:hypothetical protein
MESPWAQNSFPGGGDILLSSQESEVYLRRLIENEQSDSKDSTIDAHAKLELQKEFCRCLLRFSMRPVECVLQIRADGTIELPQFVYCRPNIHNLLAFLSPLIEHQVGNVCQPDDVRHAAVEISKKFPPVQFSFTESHNQLIMNVMLEGDALRNSI